MMRTLSRRLLPCGRRRRLRRRPERSRRSRRPRPRCWNPQSRRTGAGPIPPSPFMWSSRAGAWSSNSLRNSRRTTSPSSGGSSPRSFTTACPLPACKTTTSCNGAMSTSSARSIRRYARFRTSRSSPWHSSIQFVKLPDADSYAPETGWIDGFPVGVDRKAPETAWLTHCYGVVGIGRDNPPDNGSGTELYVVIGQAPRHLDRNIVTVGRVLRGMELLSSLPRGTGALGFYEKPEQRVPLKSIRLATDVPVSERTQSRSAAHRHSALHQVRRGSPQSPRGVVHHARRSHRRLQYQHPRARRPCSRLQALTNAAPSRGLRCHDS